MTLILLSAWVVSLCVCATIEYFTDRQALFRQASTTPPPDGRGRTIPLHGSSKTFNGTFGKFVPLDVGLGGLWGGSCQYSSMDSRGHEPLQ